MKVPIDSLCIPINWGLKAGTLIPVNQIHFTLSIWQVKLPEAAVVGQLIHLPGVRPNPQSELTID
jgi:hypothetical protein